MTLTREAGGRATSAADAKLVRTCVFPPSRRDGLLLLLVVACALSLRLYQFRGFGATDDAAYAALAHQIANGTFVPGAYSGPAVFPLRVGITVPTALAFHMLGVSEWSLVLFPLIVSLLGVLLAYVATGLFFGRRAALLAAAIWALLPLDTFHATILVPDPVAAFFGSLGVVTLLVVVGARIRRPGTVFAAGLGAGCLFGISWLSKESVVYLAPFCAFLLIAGRGEDRRFQLALWSGVFAGATGVLATEIIWYARSTGDWLFHLHETERNYTQYPNAFLTQGSTLTGSEGSYAKAILKRLVLTGPVTIFLTAQFLYLPLMATLTGVFALVRRHRSFLLPGLWFASLVLMFNFGSSSLQSYVPLVLFERYLYPVMLPATIMVAGGVEALLAASAGAPGTFTRAAACAGTAVLLMCVLLVGAQRNYVTRQFAPGWTSETKALSGRIAPSDRLYTDALSINGLEFFWGYPATMNAVNFEDMAPSAAIETGSYVLLNQRYLEWHRTYAGWWPTRGPRYRKPAFASAVPASWRKLWHNGNAALYRVE